MKRRPVLQAFGALSLLLRLAGCRDHLARSGGPRIVSLAPAITDTLFTLGAGALVVGISDFCDGPPEALSRPRLGTSITPNYEAIARLAPSLIVSEANASARRRELEALAPTRLLPWLTLNEVANSITELGALTHHENSAHTLAADLRARLDVPEPPSGPRVLLVLGSETGSSEVWFVRRNSLHGAALRAAGARNAVDHDVNGPPQLSQEALLAIDPDAILVLTRPGAPAREPLAAFTRLPTLSAVRQQRLTVVDAPEAFSNGPRILHLIDRLHAALVRLKVLP